MDITNKIQLYVSTPEADMVRDNKLLHKRILMDLNTIRQMFVNISDIYIGSQETHNLPPKLLLIALRKAENHMIHVIASA